MNRESEVISHYCIWALSDPNDDNLTEMCEYLHTLTCEDCDRLQSTLEDIQKAVEKIKQSNREEFRQEVQNAAYLILEWQKHILRRSQQE